MDFCHSTTHKAYYKILTPRHYSHDPVQNWHEVLFHDGQLLRPVVDARPELLLGRAPEQPAQSNDSTFAQLRQLFL